MGNEGFTNVEQRLASLFLLPVGIVTKIKLEIISNFIKTYLYGA